MVKRGDEKIKIMIAAGGTGGHVFPGVAIAEEIAVAHPEAEVLFAGTDRGLEADVCARLQIPVVLMPSESIKDRKGLARVASVTVIPVSVMRGLRIIMEEKPDILVSIGGYASGPLALAAWIMRVPVVIVEPNAIAGFTNRILGFFAKKAFIAFDTAAKYFPRRKVVSCGVPIRREVLLAAGHGGAQAGIITIFVFGGSQGALTLNRAITGAANFLGEVRDKIRVIHQTGANDDVSAIKNAYAGAQISAEVFEFSDRIWECYSRADIVVARAGAVTLAELLALNIPSILVPYPFAADDHQRANAREAAKTGGAVMILDRDLTGERLSRELKIFIERPELLLAMRSALEKAGRPDAAKVIVEESWKLIQGRRSSLVARRS